MLNKNIALLTISLICGLFVSSASACMLKISAAQKASQAGGEDEITVQFIQTHRNCSINPEETKIETQGMKIVSQSEWQNVRPAVYECTFKVEYPEAGKAVFKAQRICPKGGMTKELKISVQ